MNVIAFPDHLARAVSSRRARLGRTQEQLAQYGGPSGRAVRDIEAARIEAITESALAKLDRGLDWAPGSAARILDGGTPDNDDTVEQWEALAEAVRRRRDSLRLRQSDLEALGGPGPGTVRNIEQAARKTYASRTFAQLERALSWPNGTADRILAGTATGTEVATPQPCAEHMDEDARALRIGHAVLTLLRELGQETA